MSRRSKTYHLTLKDERTKKVTGQVNVVCRACGDEVSLLLPCSIQMFSAVTREFQREHRDCRHEWEEQRVRLLKVLLSKASLEARRRNYWV